jgi:hypothetical protein
MTKNAESLLQLSDERFDRQFLEQVQQQQGMGQSNQYPHWSNGSLLPEYARLLVWQWKIRIAGNQQMGCAQKLSIN